MKLRKTSLVFLCFLTVACTKNSKEQEKISEKFFALLASHNCESSWELCSDKIKKTTDIEVLNMVCDSFGKTTEVYGKDLTLIFKGTEYDPQNGYVNFYKYKFKGDTATKSNILLSTTFRQDEPDKIFGFQFLISE